MFKYLIGLSLLILVGCSESHSSVSGPDIDDIGNKGTSVKSQNADAVCHVGGSTTNTHTVTTNSPTNIPTNSPSNPPIVPPSDTHKTCDDTHFGGGNGGFDCGKDNPNKVNGINDGPTKGKKNG